MDTPGISGRDEVMIALRDGSPAMLRPVVPEDRVRLQAGLSELSPASRYFRFFVPVRALAEAQLRYFTEVDQTDHVAWLAVNPRRPNQPGLGIGRFVRLKEEAAVAEVALTVVDAQQGKGVGTHLLAVLSVMARSRAIRVLRGVALPDNRRVVSWFLRLGATVRFAGGLYHLELPTTAAGPPSVTREAFEALAARLRALLVSHGRPDELTA